MKRALLLLALVACGRPFKVETAPGFVELENQEPDYAWRVTSPEGVVMSIKAIDVPSDKGDLEFWTKAVTLELRDQKGYALVRSQDVSSLDGTKGRQLRFGHDEDGKPYAYWLTLYLAQDRLFLVEAGGTKADFDRYEASIDWMERSVKVRCGAFVSHTCNRW